MADIAQLCQDIKTIKDEYTTFDEGVDMQNYRSKTKVALGDVLVELTAYNPRMHNLIRYKLQDDIGDTEELLRSIAQKITIQLDLLDLFRSGYSTNVDLEVEQDVIHMQKSEILDVKLEDKRPLFQYRDIKGGDHAINPRLGTLEIQAKQKFLQDTVGYKPRFASMIKTIPSNTMSPGDMNHLQMYAESDRLPDQLAYCFYTRSKENIEKFLWLGDHQRYSGINGLSVALYQMIENYMYTGEGIYTQSIYSPYTDLLAKSPVITEFNAIFDGYISIDVASKPGCLIYKLGPKFK